MRVGCGKGQQAAGQPFQCNCVPFLSAPDTLSFPFAGLLSRINGERAQSMRKANEQALQQLARDLAALQAAGANAQEVQQAEKQLQMLKEFCSLPDAGAIYDVLCWQDAAGVWRAAVDTQCDGDLSKAAGMTNFRAERQWAVLDQDTLLAYALNIYEEGKVVSIVTDAGSHG